MKFCPHCGREVSANSKFCPGCGGSISTEPVSGWNSGAGEETTVGNPAKRAVASPLFLAAVVAYSIGLLFNLIRTLNFNTNQLLVELMDQVPGFRENGIEIGDLYQEFYRLTGGMSLDALDGMLKGVGLLFLIPSVIFCIGLWLVWNTARDKTRVSTTGFTMMRVILVIDLIAYALLVLICILASIIIMIGEEAAPGIVMLVTFLIIGGLVLFFYIRAINSVGTIKNDMITGGIPNKLSNYVAVIGFISGVLSVFTLFGQSGFANMINVLAHIVWVFCASIWIMQYKSFR